MVSSARKVSIGAGVLVVFAIWAVKTPLLLHWTNIGAISLIDLLLLLATVISILVGGLQVLLGKYGYTAFMSYLVFAAVALFATHFLFAVPFVIGAVISITALAWPLDAQQGA